MKRLVRRAPSIDVESLPSDWHPVVRRVLAARGVTDASQLDMGLEQLARPGLMQDCARAAELIAETVRSGGAMLLVGDFDADGATCCALAVRALTAMGARPPNYLVPNRFEYGYGLSPAIASVAMEQGPDLVITVDNGISSHEGVTTLEEGQVPVIVTDHHLPGTSLPAASAVVDPNREGDGHPAKSLAGVGVIFHVLLEVRRRLRDVGWFSEASEPPMADLLDLVALGTVADVVELDRTNRILVEQGLRRIRSGVSIPGIQALLEVAGRDQDRINAADLGFAVGPRLNAAGRLDDMTVGIECLLADNPETAASLAGRLDALNRERRTIETRMRDEAVATVEALREQVDDRAAPCALCVYSPDWHEGVVGIVAGRVKEHFHRPVIAFAPTQDGDALKGSGRSIPGLHMRDVLVAIDARYPGLMRGFGGHAMAAGLTIAEDQLDSFKPAFESSVAERVDEEVLAGAIHFDGELEAAHMTADLAGKLRHLQPWGQGFPEPVFSNRFQIHGSRVVGERHLKMTVAPEEGGPTLDAIAFNAVDRGWDRVGERAVLTYKLDLNRYRGRDRVQLVVEHIDGETGSA